MNIRKILGPLSTMSLKRYLFLIIAVFVLLLAATQLIFINYIQHQMSSEVEDKSRALSKQALKLLVDTLPNSENVIDERIIGPAPQLRADKGSVLIRINKTPNKVVDLGDGYEFVTGNQTHTIQLESATKTPRIEFRERLEGQLQSLRFKPLNNSYTYAVSHNSNDQMAQHIVQFGKQDSAVYQYFRWLIGGTIGLTLLGLLLAYWLANHISQPLQALSSGFMNLEKGQLGSQVSPTGIKEVRDTMQSFNQMSRRLVELSEVKKRFGQQQQMAELGEVARGLAHTLRNPINTIGLAIEQMGHTNMTQDERIELAAQVRQKISHLDNSIKGLLSLTTSDIQRDQPVDINQVIHDVLLEMSMTSPINIAFSPVQSVKLLGAEVEIRAMIHTLVVNGIEASELGQTVSIFVSEHQQTVTISVLDEGHGLDPNLKPQLFKPHITNKPEGAGMGLYIVKRISQLHYQGDIQLTENVPKGCVATLTLTHAKLEQAFNE